MRNRCTRVARPRSTSSTPVANGSSVPAWPTFVARPCSRRTAATTSCDVFPAGLSTRRSPSGTRERGELGGDGFAQEGADLVLVHVRREARGLAVPATAGGAGHRGDVDLRVGGAQRHLRVAGALRPEL